MPNWKKVLVSGSDAVLNNITASGDITSSGDIFTNTLSTIEFTIGGDGSTTVDSFDTSLYNGAIYDYILVDTTVGARAGQFMVAHDNGLLTFTDTSTAHLADLVTPEISASINSPNVEIKVTDGGGYTFKSFTKKL